MLSSVYVDDSATGLNNGTSWADAYTNLQAALAAAVAPQEIRVGQGTYKPTAGSDRTVSFALKNGVTILGGYAGSGAPDADARNIALHTTILSGDIGAPGDATDNSYHVVVGSGTDSTAVLDGCTITGGKANGSSSNTHHGGGMYSSSSSSTLTNCTFTANSASSNGGGMYNDSSSSPTLSNCTFTANSAGGSGGGMYNDSSSSPKLTNCTLTVNSASLNGGGAYSYSSSATLTNCILWANTAPYGSQISGSAAVTYCDVQGASSAAGNINLDPQFVRRPDAGPDGAWGTADDDYGDLRLRLISPCIDAGKNSAVPTGIITDMAGNPRFVDVPAVANSGSGTAPLVDMGAYEAPAALQALTGGPYRVVAGSSVVLAGAGGSPTGLAVSCAWDFDGDGQFDDASGPTPVFSAAGMQGPLTLTIALRVTDTLGATSIQTAVLRVLRPNYYVDDSAAGLNDGTSWADAYTNLQSALAVAVPGQVIAVAQGTYKPTTGTDRAATFSLKTGVAIYGGFAGYGAPDPGVRDVGLYASILSGDVGTAGSTSDNSYHVVTCNGTNSAAVLDGFTITGGNANRSNSNAYGGGIYNSSSSPMLTNCTLIANSAGYGGGGMYNADSSSPVLTNCTFTANSATGAYDGVYAYGGGMYNNSSSPTLTDCTFIANSVGCGGGGMYNAASSSPVLTNCTFAGNSATAAYAASYAYGGGMYNSSSSPTLTNCTFAANSAIPAYAEWNSWGGGMDNSSSSPTLTNCTFTANSAISSGGMYNSDSSPRLTNCILWANTDRTGHQIYTSSGAPVVAYCDVQGLYGGGNFSLDPQFVRNPGPGADATWGTADDDYGDLRLRLISPCIDAGKNSAVPVGITTDMAGSARFADVPATPDTGSGTRPLVDIGAYEAPAAVQALAGGPYSVAEGFTIVLTGAGYSPSGRAVSLAWDLDSDGQFDDASGSAPVFSAAGMQGSQTLTVALRVTDTSGASAIGTAALGVLRPHCVDDSAPGLNNGTSWANAYTSLQAALAAAVPGEAIAVAQGTYKPTTGADRAATFTLKSGVAIYGGYAGYGATDPNVRNVGLYPTILAGDIGTVGNTADNSYHVVTASGTISTAVLDGVTITGGNANGAYPYGGGMYVSGGSPTLINCTFIANWASYRGGGMYNEASSSPTLTNCAFIDNSSSSYGGGMYNGSSCSPTLTNCTFTANSASLFGGGIDNSSSSPALTNCILWANTATAASVAQIHNDYSTAAVVRYCDIQDGYSGAGNIGLDPLFVRNPNPGPDGSWRTADDDYGDLRLRLTSPCVDAGANSAVPVGIATDLSGNPRFVDVPAKADTGSGTAPLVDMGAYESPVAVQAVAGGPYRVVEGFSIVLAGAGYSPTGRAVSLAWDFDGDGQFDDASGAAPVFSAAVVQGPQTLTIALRVTDTSGASSVGTAALQVVRPLYVDDSAGGLNNGIDWADAYTSLQAALAAAVPGGAIAVAQGTYKPTTGADRAATFSLKSSVAIYGGYAGHGATDPNVRNVGLYPTILSGDIGTAGSNADNSYRVVTCIGTSSTVVLDGLTITGGNANGITPNPYVGGGMYNYSSSLTLINCTFIANAASDCGGGLYSGSSPIAPSSPTLINCTFTANAAAQGGGMYNASNSSPTLTNCTFTANSASSYGGGMYNYSSSSPMLTNCIFWANTAPSGSQIHTITGTPVITYCDIQGGYNGAGNINLDPRFVRNPGAGPDGTWLTADDDYGDLRLLLTSPCIDAGNNSPVPTGITTDLTGNPRFADVPGVPNTGSGTAPLVDMGAYESPNPSLVVAGTGSPDEFSLNLSPDEASIRIVGPGGSNTYSVLAITAITANGGEGDDQLTVDFSNGNPVPSGGVAFDGQGGNDELRIVAHGYNATLTGEQVSVGTAAPIAFSNTEGTSFDLGSGKLTKIDSSTAVLVDGSIYSGGTEVLGGTLVVGHAHALPAGGSLMIGAGATVVLPSALIQAAVGDPRSAALPMATAAPTTHPIVWTSPAELAQVVTITAKADQQAGGLGVPVQSRTSSANLFSSPLSMEHTLPTTIARDRALDSLMRPARVQSAPTPTDTVPLKRTTMPQDRNGRNATAPVLPGLEGRQPLASLAAGHPAVKKKGPVPKAVDQVLAALWRWTSKPGRV